ncbi:alkaline phosphatase D family protein [Nocardioides sp. CBS4Y-1]|uniref:Alkaline phosphatase D family protein n=1 Tax=Nocardioides acrostichi TaxID=2784339 RepID=A0A930V0B5_9ACTN|nr:alkaline phosphatase D family protein [Nocardioides acrostichi]
MATTAAASAGALTTSLTHTAAAETVDGRPRVDHFQHGVASGDPLPHAVLIWTRVTPTATATPGSGQGPAVTVRWKVARDERMRHVVKSGNVRTSASRDHTVKVDVGGLEPATTYYYRFFLGGQRSRRGRLRTAPTTHATVGDLRLGLVSCANLQAGWFSAYRGIADRDDLDAVLHLGDYLYEYGPGEYGMGPDDIDVRPHDPPHEMVSLSDYRRRHAQYKTDPDLQRAHARHTWITTWDDHEVANDTWKHGAENHTPGPRQDGGEGSFLRRRARAHRAYDEWMPARLNETAKLGDGDRLYRSFRFGDLASISMLDLRTYRDKQAAYPVADGTVSDPSRSITGDAQMAWLKGQLTTGDHAPQWKIIGNPVMIAPVTFADLPNALVDPVNDVTGLIPADGAPYNVDQWDGYTADRREVLTHLRDHQVKDALFVTGDIHSGWACELPLDTSTYPAVGDSFGVEFVCSSVTSNNLKDITGQPQLTPVVETAILANNRHIKYLDFDSHGFSVLDVTAERAQCDWFVIGTRAEKDTDITWSVSYATTAGTQKVQQVDAPVPAKRTDR